MINTFCIESQCTAHDVWINNLNFAQQIKVACNWKLCMLTFFGQPKFKATSFGIFEYFLQ